MEYNLNKHGFCIVNSALEDFTIERYQKEIKNFSNLKKTELNQSLVKHNLLWDYISNKKIIDKIETSLEKKIFFLNDSGFSYYKNNEENRSTNLEKISWHRDTDSVDPIKDVVPYPKGSEYFKVFTAITYLCEENKQAKINLLPYSHLKKFRFTIRNILRFFHWKTKNKKVYKYLRRFILKLIGLEIKLNSGDCLIFCVSLFHMPMPSEGNRAAIISRFGIKGDSAENYLNYVLKNSSRGKEHYSNTRKDIENFNIFLKEKNIFYKK